MTTMTGRAEDKASRGGSSVFRIDWARTAGTDALHRGLPHALRAAVRRVAAPSPVAALQGAAVDTVQ
jgi:hypothetical protein